LYATEAAVELLIGHGAWLGRDDFVAVFVETGVGWSDATSMAWVDWSGAVAALDVGRLACCDSEAGVLRVAASIAEAIPVALGGALVGLDEANMLLVARAVVHAAGGRDAAASVGGTVGR
jgi:hypothetical protein